METHSNRVVFFEDADGILEYEMYDGCCILHSQIYSWKLSVFKKCLRVLNTLLNTMRMMGIQYVVAITPNPEFAKLFGGHYISTMEYEDKEYEGIIWDLK